MDFLLIVKNVFYWKVIYVFDSNIYELIDKLESVLRVLKYVKVNFYILKSLIESGNFY